MSPPAPRSPLLDLLLQPILAYLVGHVYVCPLEPDAGLRVWACSGASMACVTLAQELC
jgi:hypothetical protein